MNRESCRAEVLESRTLMSAGGANAALDASVRADRLAVQIDLLHFRSDSFACSAALLADVAALKADHLHNEATIGPMITQMRLDLKNMHNALLMDRLNEASNVLADELIIVTDLKQKLLDKGTSARRRIRRSCLPTISTCRTTWSPA